MRGRKDVKNSQTLPPGQTTSWEPAEEDLGLRLRTGIRDAAGRAYRGENSGLLLIVMIGVVVIFGILLRDTSFLGASNLVSIVETTTAVSVMAVPTVFVICSGEIDLSFATVVPVSAYIAAIFLEHHRGIPLAVITALAFGALVGLINGFVTVVFRIPSFVVTLGMLGVLQGYSEAIANSATLTVTNQTFLKIFGQGSVGPIPSLVLWSVGATIVGSFILAYTPTGRHVMATGANANAARFSGIKTGRVKIAVLMFSGIGGALAGLIYVGQFTAATYTLGSSDLLNVLAAVIVGGTVLAGGQGSVVGAFIGSLLIGLIGNALIILGLATPEQLMARGLIIILAVILSSRPRGRGSFFTRRLSFLRKFGLVATSPRSDGTAAGAVADPASNQPAAAGSPSAGRQPGSADAPPATNQPRVSGHSSSGDARPSSGQEPADG
jgi:ribose transport system permease protein